MNIDDSMDDIEEQNNTTGLEIAVIGMAGRFPGAKNIDEFWENLKNGVESITFFNDDELIEHGASPGTVNKPGFVKARGILDRGDYFDAAFFGYTPAEAAVMDPQLRVGLECAREAFDNAGYNPEAYDGPIGVYAGASSNLLWEIQPFLAQPGGISGQFNKTHLVDKDFLCMRIAYALNLKGPAAALFTTCSTSLAAVDMACRALLTGQCDMALAGGVSISLPVKRGYLYEEGMVMSSDGHVRAFDASASGTNGGDGVGFVVLKSLEEALTDRDFIHAVIKGSEVNNDGADKAGFQAPGVSGQASVIRAALHISEVEPESIGYVETHGTGTPLGDPIEIEALTQAFAVDKKQFCKIGSVKTNVGHLDSAAGITGFIKTVLALKHKQIPPSLHFVTPNPKIDFENSPFYVNTTLSEWNTGGRFPRRAGVSSFGIGGTNAHVILEEAPGESGPAGLKSEKIDYRLLVLSAKTGPALERMTAGLVEFFKRQPGTMLADAAYTLQTGRQAFEHRRMLACSSIDGAAECLGSSTAGGVHTVICKDNRRPVVFLFAGQGSQYVDMGLDLYREQPVFRRELDRCFDILSGLTDVPLKAVLYPGESAAGVSPPAAPEELILRQEVAQPLVFAFEYALGRLSMEWGIKPYAMMGYSLGEYVPACLAGVFSLEDALALLVFRGKLVQEIPGGAMLSVPLEEEQVKSMLGEDLDIAVVNGPSCIVSGATGAVDRLRNELKKQKLMGMDVSLSHAMHSFMMDPLLERYEARLRQATLNAPAIPLISNVTGTWMSHEDAAAPRYWVNQFRNTVRFSDGIKELLNNRSPILLEIGPGSDLSTIVRQMIDKGTPPPPLVNTLRHPQQRVSDVYLLKNRVGRLWLHGAVIDWAAFHGNEKRRRIPLPAYPFEPVRFPAQVTTALNLLKQAAAEEKKRSLSDWFYIPNWKISPLPVSNAKPDSEKLDWLILGDNGQVTQGLVNELRQRGHHITLITPETRQTFFGGPGGDFMDRVPDRVVHLWGLSDENGLFDSLLFLAGALGRQGMDKKIRIFVVTSNMQGITGDDLLYPAKALALGAVRVIPREYPNISCRSIDVALESGDDAQRSAQREQLLPRLLQEIFAGTDQPVTAYRGLHRMEQTFDPYPPPDIPGSVPPRLKRRGVYLITGGLGGIGLTLAGFLARTVQARLILTGRSAFPLREQWRQNLDRGEPEAARIQALLEMENQGAEVMVCSADASDPGQMKAVLGQAGERWGRVNGIIHAAGIVQGGLVPQITARHIQEGFKPKVHAALALEELLKDKKINEALDFIILCSSLNALAGAVGEAVYCAANAFLDAFAHYASAKYRVFTAAVNWDAWQEVGFAVEVQKRWREAFNGGGDLPDQLFKNGLKPDQGVEAFKRILGSHTPQVVVSTVELEERFKIADGLEAALARTGKRADGPRLNYPRPELSIPYAPPGNDMEKQLCQVWEQFLGLEHVGVHDNFFELGASSLGIVQVTGIIDETLGKNLPVPTLYAYPTVHELARHLNGVGPGNDAAGQPVELVEEPANQSRNRLKQRKKRLDGGLT
jgi:acyl transferase domain-containing protein/NAD(P)-dependent dehydrogenase (short-subunit alcohol dehydrogenase family)/acyl carrier protein